MNKLKPEPRTLCFLRWRQMPFRFFPGFSLFIFLLLPLFGLPQSPEQTRQEEPSTSPARSFLKGLMSELREVPVLGNVLRASVHPIYKPLVDSISFADEREGGKGLCMGDLGCLETPDAFFDPIYRPVNLPPYPRRDINTVFTLHTPWNRTGIVVPNDNAAAIVNATFSSSQPTKIIIHGFLDDPSASWMVDMVAALLTTGPFNVFTVNWSGGSRALYSQAVANIRVVALEVALLVTTLEREVNLQLEDVHIIGHSLGAHTAGYVGERVPGLGRITGLDPAEPLFQHLPPMVRLDPSDATFVDVIHTDSDSILSLGYGLQQPVGHLDFYPNGGRNQPGCDTLYRVPLTAFKQGLDAARKELVACNHNRAPKLFVDALVSPCPYMAFACSSYKEYEEGLCFNCGPDGGECATLGLHADQWPVQNRTHVQMFLSTTNGPPYCVYHHLVTVALADPTGTGGHLRGRLTLTFINVDGTLSEFDLTKTSPYSFPRGGASTFIIEHQHDLSVSTHVLVKWAFEADMFNPLTFCVLFCSSDLPIASVLVDSVDTESKSRNRLSTVILCNPMGLDHTLVSSEQTVTLSSMGCTEAHWLQQEQVSGLGNTSVYVPIVLETQDKRRQSNLLPKADIPSEQLNSSSKTGVPSEWSSSSSKAGVLSERSNSSSKADIPKEQDKQEHLHYIDTPRGTPGVPLEKQFNQQYERRHQGQQRHASRFFSFGSSMLSLLPFQDHKEGEGFSSMWNYMLSFLPSGSQNEAQGKIGNGMGSEELGLQPDQGLGHPQGQRQQEEGQGYFSPFDIFSFFQGPVDSGHAQAKQQRARQPALYRRLLQAETRQRAQQILERHREQQRKRENTSRNTGPAEQVSEATVTN